MLQDRLATVELGSGTCLRENGLAGRDERLAEERSDGGSVLEGASSSSAVCDSITFRP